MNADSDKARPNPRRTRLAIVVCFCAAIVAFPVSASSETEKTADNIAAMSEHDLPALKNVYPPHFMRMENEKLGETTDSDYLDAILKQTKGKVFRFKSMPIPVYIEPASDRRYPAACIAGFELWESATDGLVRFVQVNELDRARIRVVWDHLGVTGDPRRGALGAHTMMKWQATPGLKTMSGIPLPLLEPKYKVPPQVIKVNLDVIVSRDLETQPLLLKNVVAHELGHALGIIGHSPDRSDLMFEDTDEYSRLSQRDVNTIKRLYEKKVDVAL